MSELKKRSNEMSIIESRE